MILSGNSLIDLGEERMVRISVERATPECECGADHHDEPLYVIGLWMEGGHSLTLVLTPEQAAAISAVVSRSVAECDSTALSNAIDLIHPAGG